MGSSPCRRIHLLGITHLIVRKHFWVLKVHPEVDTSEELVEKEARLGIVMYFVKIWVENPVSVLYKDTEL